MTFVSIKIHFIQFKPSNSQIKIVFLILISRLNPNFYGVVSPAKLQISI